MTDARLARLEALGYTVDYDDDSGVVGVNGYGAALAFPLTEPLTMDSLLDVKKHAKRKAEFHRHDSPRADALDG